MKLTVKQLPNVSKLSYIELVDDSSYEPGKEANGGRYRYIEIYQRVNKDTWEVEYRTSAEFDFCRVTGMFASCETCSDWDSKNRQCTAELQTVSEEQVVRRLAQADGDRIYVREAS